MDTSNSGKEGWKVRETAPFELREGETLSLDVFIDKCVVEVYANERQAICRRVYPTCPEKSVGAELIGKTEDVLKLETYRMFPANPY